MNNIFKPHQRSKEQNKKNEEERQVSFGEEKMDNHEDLSKTPIEGEHTQWMRNLASRSQHKRKAFSDAKPKESFSAAYMEKEDIVYKADEPYQPKEESYGAEEKSRKKPSLSIGRNKEFGSQSQSSPSYWLWLVLGSFSILLIAVMSLRFLDKNEREAAGFDKPFIALENVEWKVRPDDPGGAEIPFENLEIMDTTGNARLLQNQVDLLLPSAEDDEKTSDYSAREEQSLQDQVANLLDIAGVSEDALFDENVENAFNETESNGDMHIARRVETPSDIPVVNGSISAWQVQLSTVFSETDARAEWQRFARRYGNLILEQPVLISHIGDNYMLRIGHFDTSRKANELCERIKNAGGDCLLYSPR